MDADLLSKLDRLALGLGRDLIYGLMGEHRAQRRTTGIEFADYRPYTPGDDLRRVDWNAYARLGTLQVRQAQAEHDTVLYLLVDASPSMAFGTPSKFLAARRLAAALGYIALAHLDAVVLAAPGVGGGWGLGAGGGQDETSDPALAADPRNPQSAIRNPQSLVRGRAEAGRLFRQLQELPLGSPATFDDLLVGWSTRPGQGRLAILVSDLLLDGYRDGVRRLVAAGFQVALLQVLSPDELRPGETGDLDLVDSETGDRLEVHLGKESLAAYDANLRAWLAETADWCRDHGTGYLLVESAWDIERVLLEHARQRGITA
jgi:uncharacterized protein (DUF58 family)